VVDKRDWVQLTIGQFGQIVTGSTPPTKKPEYFGNIYPFITPTDMNDNSRIVNTERFVSEKGRLYLKNRLLPVGSVCFTCIGATIGKLCVTSKPSFTNQQINSVVVDEEHDPLFVYYLLCNEAERIKKVASGAATPIINKTAFSNIEVRVPSLALQRRITIVLSAYDDLLENNTRRIAILEEMAQALYREWFVHFRFPGHESVAMVEDGNGRLPEGWERKTIIDICDRITSGGTPNTQESSYWNGEIPWLSSGETRNKFIIETEKTITSDGVENSSTRLAMTGSVVIASAGQGHTRGQTSLLMLDTYVNQSVLNLSASHVSNYYLFFNLSDRYSELRQASDSFSSRGSLTTKLIGSLPIVVPKKNLVSNSQFEIRAAMLGGTSSSSRDLIINNQSASQSGKAW
jgi:type I restriction enzyme, S subunit